MKHTNMNTIVRILGWAFMIAFAPLSVRAECTNPYLIWSNSVGGTGFDIAYSVATDQVGNIFITGSFESTVNFGGVTLTSAGAQDIFVAKYNSSGVLQWAQRAGSTGLDEGRVIGTDPAGNVYVGGLFQGTINFAPPPLTATGTADGFLVKFDTFGNWQWQFRYGSTGGPGIARPFNIATDASVVVITGEYTGTASFGGSTFSSFGSEDIFVARYSVGGVHQWSKAFGAANFDKGWGVALDPGSNVIITGSFRGSVNFGGAVLVGNFPSAMYLAKYNSAGTHQWSSVYNGGTGSDGFAVATDAASNVIVTGGYSTQINFGGGLLTAVNAYEAFLVKFNSAGTHQWSKSFAGSGGESGQALAVDAASNIILGGQGASGTVDLGGGPMSTGGDANFFGKFDLAGSHLWSTVISGGIEPNVARDPSSNVITTGFVGANVLLRKFGPDTVQPCIESIVDVGNDEGRAVKISFFKSGYDRAGAPAQVVRYDAYRRDDAPPSLVSTMTLSDDELATVGWQFVGSVPAHGESEYLLGAPTLADSTIENGMFQSVFFIRAATAVPTVFYDSAIDSGYSKDNLSPLAPSNLVINDGTLTWDRSEADDFDHYNVYASTSGAFANATLLAQPTEATLDVSANTHAVFFVTALDAAGNESKASRAGATGDDPRAYSLAVSCHPNPFNPRTTVSYSVPSRGSVRVAVYDLRGAHVATLFQGDRSPGAYVIDWDGRAGNGTPVASGIYFARIEHNGATRSKKMVLLK